MNEPNWELIEKCFLTAMKDVDGMFSIAFKRNDLTGELEILPCIKADTQEDYDIMLGAIIDIFEIDTILHISF